MDRNNIVSASITVSTTSLSARRAWIEIVITAMTSQISVVALRKESVDRNCPGTNITLSIIVSLSARRAWIEINVIYLSSFHRTGRSPQGERG